MIEKSTVGKVFSLFTSLHSTINAYLESTSQHFSHTRLGQSDRLAARGGDHE